MTEEEKQIKILEEVLVKKEKTTSYWYGYNQPGFFPHQIIEAYVNEKNTKHNLGKHDEIFVRTNRLSFHCPITELNLLDLYSLVDYFKDRLRKGGKRYVRA